MAAATGNDKPVGTDPFDFEITFHGDSPVGVFLSGSGATKRLANNLLRAWWGCVTGFVFVEFVRL
jgi:hypothetical protein